VILGETGSESEGSPVRKTGSKQRGTSPRISRPTKRPRSPIDSSESDSCESDHAPAAVRHKPNPVPLEQRISDARSARSDIAPSLQPSPAMHKRVAHSSGHAPAQTSARATTSSHPDHSQSYASRAPPPPASTPFSSNSSSAYPPGPARWDGNHHPTSSHRGGFRGRGGGQGRGPGGRGKARARDAEVAPALHNLNARPNSEAQIVVGKVDWTKRSFETFKGFCNEIEFRGYGPAPIHGYAHLDGA